MLQVKVILPSGRSENLSLLQSSKVGDLKIRAQQILGQGFLKLVTADGHVLTDPNEKLQAAGLEDGDHVTAIALQVKLAATENAALHSGVKEATEL